VPAYLRRAVFSVSGRSQTPKGMRAMNDLFLLEPEYRYHAERAREGLKPVRSRRRRRRLLAGGRTAVTSEKNWIS
jgi:hypothetical protein